MKENNNCYFFKLTDDDRDTSLEKDGIMPLLSFPSAFQRWKEEKESLPLSFFLSKHEEENAMICVTFSNVCLSQDNASCVSCLPSCIDILYKTSNTEKEEESDI